LTDHAHDHDHEHAHDHAKHEHVTHAGGGHSHPEHDHDHQPKFSPAEARQVRRLTIVLVIVTLFFGVEFVGARMAQSDVLEADAIHLLMDVLALGMSLFAMRLAVRRPTARYTFGLRRAEPVAAVFNAILVLFAATEIVRDSLGDLLHRGAPPKENLMLAVAAAALVVNGVSAWLLHGAMHTHDHAGHEGHGHDHGSHAGHGAHGHHLNLRGAWLHLLGDALGSVAALVAALIIRFGGSSAVDPLASFIVVIILVFGALRLLKDALVVLLEAAPKHVSVHAVRELVRGVPGVLDVHDLHLWTLGAGRDAVMVHVTSDMKQPKLASMVEKQIRNVLNVEYVTVQVEPEDSDCEAPVSRYEEEKSA
jgi:cation diffusion facilitator family transporter